jgi:hypothetical protein
MARTHARDTSPVDTTATGQRLTSAAPSTEWLGGEGPTVLDRIIAANVPGVSPVAYLASVVMAMVRR